MGESQPRGFIHFAAINKMKGMRCSPHPFWKRTMSAPLCLKLFLAVAMVAVAVSPARGEEAATEGDEYLQVATKRLQAAERFSVKFDFAVTVGLPGFSHDRASRYQLHAERPKRFTLERIGGDMGATIVSDGETQYTYLKESNEYTKRPAPASLDEFSQSIEGAMLVANGMGGILMALLAEDPFTRLVEGSTSREYHGRVQIDGIDCHHVRIVHDEMDFDVYLTAGPDSTIRRIRPDLTKGMGEEEREAEFSIKIAIDLKEWNLNSTFNDKTYTFTPPAGAKEVAEFKANEPEPVLPPVEAISALVGKPAPEFSLEGYAEGDSLALNEVLGKKVVVLDFWATWCGPCREAFPQLSELAEKFADRDVLFRAINLGEDREGIAEFLEQQELKLPILLDPEAESADKYHVSAIPQIVLIGKDGKVHVVLTGTSDKLKEQLTSDIEALLAGKDLATAQRKKQKEGAAPAKEPQEGPAGNAPSGDDSPQDGAEGDQGPEAPATPTP